MKKLRVLLFINFQLKVKGEVFEKIEDIFSDLLLFEKDVFGKVKKRLKKRRKMGVYKFLSEIKKKFGFKKKDGDINSLKDEKEEDDLKVYVKSEEKISYV